MARTDLLGQISDARAAMMMRGHPCLRLEIGRDTRTRLGEDGMTVLSWPEIRAFKLRDDMEGFALVAIKRI